MSSQYIRWWTMSIWCFDWCYSNIVKELQCPDNENCQTKYLWWISQKVTFDHSTFLFVIKIFRLFEQGLYSDVTFVVDERTFPLHRCVLAARSSFFQEALEKRWHGKRQINLMKAKVLRSILPWEKPHTDFYFSSMQTVLKLSFDICTPIVAR